MTTRAHRRRRFFNEAQSTPETQESSLLPDRGSPTPAGQSASEEQQVHQELPQAQGHHLAKIAIAPPDGASLSTNGPISIQPTLNTLPTEQQLMGGPATVGPLPIQRFLDFLKPRKKAPPKPPTPSGATVPKPTIGTPWVQAEPRPRSMRPADPRDLHVSAPAAPPLHGNAGWEYDGPPPRSAAPPLHGNAPAQGPALYEPYNVASAAQENGNAPAAGPALYAPYYVASAAQENAPAGPKVEYRPRRAASLPPGAAQNAKYTTKALIPMFNEAGERRAPEKWVNDKYVGQQGALGEPVKYLTAEERAPYEVKLNTNDKKFYWEKTGQVFDTQKMTVVGRLSGGGRALFVMTESGKIYAAEEGEEGRKGRAAPPDERWRFNHSSFLAGEPVAAAGELVFKDGTLVGITDMSGHYHPDITHIRQVVTEFNAQGVNISDVWVMLSDKSKPRGEDHWYVQATDLIRYSSYDESRFRSEKIGAPTSPQRGQGG